MPIPTERQREIVRLRDQEQMAWPDIAKKMNCKEKTAKNTYTRGKQNIRYENNPLYKIKYENAVPGAIELADRMDQKSRRILDSIDDMNILDSSLYQKTCAMSQMINASRLLRGESTSNVTIEDKRKLNQLLPALLEEARRRGVRMEGAVIDGDYSVERDN